MDFQSKELIIRLECTTNGSNKFYNIRIKSDLIEKTKEIFYNVYTAHGKIGASTNYGSPVYSSNDLLSIDNFIGGVIKSKLKKGYLQLTPYGFTTLSERFKGSSLGGTKPILFITDEFTTTNNTNHPTVISASDINTNIIKAAQVKKDNKFKEEVRHWFYSLESIRDLI